MNSVDLGAGQPLQSVFPQMAAIGERVPLGQTTLLGTIFGFEPVARQEEFASCIGYASHFTQAARDMNPATPWQLEVNAEYLKIYPAVSEV